MAALSVQVPYPVFYNRDGQPLDNGNVYIGVANLDPVTNPLQVYYDEALTLTASQPLITSNGYVYRNGTPAQLYVDATNFSILVNDSKNLLVYNFPDGTGIGANASGIALTPSGYTTATNIQQGFNDLGASTGSSKVGFLQSGTGAVGMPAQTKMRQAVNMEDYIPLGTGGTQAGDSAALKAAIAYATTNQLPVILPARRIYWDGSIIAEDKVSLWGSGMPTVNVAKTALVGGTIIQGALSLTGDYIDLRNFGVDIGSASGVTTADAIKCLASPLDSGKSLHTENLIGLCNSPASAVHALLFEGYAQHTGDNLHGVNGYFGVVLKTRGVRIGSMKATDSSDTGIYFKSDNTYGQCSDVQVDIIEVIGAVDYAVRLQADSAVMDNIQINQIRAKNHQTTILAQVLDFAGAEFGSAYIGSIISENAIGDDVFVYNLKAGGRFDSLEINSITSINPAAKVVNLLNEAGAEIQAVTIGTVYANYDTAVTDAVLDGAVFVGAGVKKTTINNALLLVNGGVSSRLGALNYTTAGNVNVLGTRRARIIGAGRPANGYSIQTLTGSTATVVIPQNAAGKNTSLVKLTQVAPITITIFALPVANDNPFEVGHICTLFNAASFSVTVANNGAGNVLNPAYASVVLAENEVRAWVYGEDGVWRGLP
jgi:hypothetical protein